MSQIRPDECEDLLGALAARTRMVTRMLPLNLTADDRAAAIRDVVAYCRKREISQADLARGTGLNQTYVSAIFTGNLTAIPAASLDAAVRKLNNFVELYAQRHARKVDFKYVQTEVAKRLFSVAQNAQVLGCMACCWGPAGIGKTVAAQAAAREIPGAVYLLVTTGGNTQGKLLRRLWEELHTRGGNERYYYEHVLERLRGSQRLIMVDQAHRLRGVGRIGGARQNATLEMLMDLHDEAGVPVLLIGTKDIRKHVSSDDDPFYGQLSSRVALRIDLLPGFEAPFKGGKPRKWLTVEQIQKMFQRESLRLHPDAARALLTIALTKVGFLRTAYYVFLWASGIATKTGQAVITAELIERGLRKIDQTQRVGPPVEDDSAPQEAAAAS